MVPLTSSQIAAELGVSRQTITRAARQHEIGTTISRRGERIYSRADLATLRRVVRGARGNPGLRDRQFAREMGRRGGLARKSTAKKPLDS